jgi:hypothetical protein
MAQSDDTEQLRQAFDRLPKVAEHGAAALERHDSIRPEWVMQTIAEPYERYATHTTYGERRTVLTGRVPDSTQWITIVFVGDPGTGRFLTAYHNKNLAKRYGGRPWDNQ